jgi:group I intron endonuclease
MASAIYAIVNNVTCDMYVGSAVAVNRRWSSHRRDLAKQCHYNTRLQRAYDKYGKDVFDWEIVQFVDDKSKLIDREQFWINFFIPAYNGRPVANSPLGTKHSAETRAKMSASAKKKVFTEEHKQNISNAKKGICTTSEEQKKRLSELNKGKVFSAESRAKISATSIGRYHTDEAKQKISVANKARWAAIKGNVK